MTSNFECIDIATAKQWIEQGALVVDIRDGQSFQQGHIQDAIHLTNDNVEQFLVQIDPQQALIVCCYHGLSSQSAAQFLCDKGYSQVASLNGGYQHWSEQHA